MNGSPSGKDFSKWTNEDFKHVLTPLKCPGASAMPTLKSALKEGYKSWKNRFPVPMELTESEEYQREVDDSQGNEDQECNEEEEDVIRIINANILLSLSNPVQV